MKRVWTHAVGAVVAVGGLAVVAPAFANDNTSFLLYAVLAPPPGASTSGCTFTSDPTQPRLATGILDVDLVAGANNDYTAWFLVANQIVQQENQPQLQAESSRIFVKG